MDGGRREGEVDRWIKWGTQNMYPKYPSGVQSGVHKGISTDRGRGG